MKMTLDLSPELEERIKNWSIESKEPPENLAIGLIEEYFEDCDDAEKICAEVEAGHTELYPWEEVKAELHGMAS